jgi:hypothetical protein
VTAKDAEKILAAMRASAANKKQEDMEDVALGFGFDVWEGTNHTTYQHPKHPKLVGQWPRHGEVYPVYVRKLVQRIDQLEELERSKNNG